MSNFKQQDNLAGDVKDLRLLYNPQSGSSTTLQSAITQLFERDKEQRAALVSKDFSISGPLSTGFVPFDLDGTGPMRRKKHPKDEDEELEDEEIVDVTKAEGDDTDYAQWSTRQGVWILTGLDGTRLGTVTHDSSGYHTNAADQPNELGTYSTAGQAKQELESYSGVDTNTPMGHTLKPVPEELTKRDKALKPILSAVVTALGSLPTRTQTGTVAPVSFVDKATTVLQNGYERATLAGLKQVATDIGVGRTSRVALTDEQLQQAVDDAQGQREYLTGLAQDLHTITDDSLSNRLSMYAASTTGAYEQGYSSGYQTAYPKGIATWHTSGDDKVCDGCALLDGQTFAIKDIPFFPGQGDVGSDGCECGVMCRCYLTYEDGEEADTPTDEADTTDDGDGTEQ